MKQQGYRIAATCPNETIAQSFVEFWNRKGYIAQTVERVMISDDGTRLGNWVVLKSTRKAKK